MKNEIVTRPEEENGEIITKTETRNDLFTYCSVVAKTTEEKKHLFNALESADVLLMDVVGTEFNLKDVYLNRYERLNNDTGEYEDKVRIILFDEEGKTYASGSFGIFNTLRRIFEVFGTPEKWSEPLKVKVVQKSIDNTKKILSLELI